MKKNSDGRQGDFHLEAFPVGPLGATCVLLGDVLTGKAFIVDPGGDADLIRARVAAGRWQVVGLLHTHGHLDHCGATGELKKVWSCPVYLHPDDRFLFEKTSDQAAFIGLETSFPPLSLDRTLAHDERLVLGKQPLRVLHTPGHSPGSVCFFQDPPASPILIAGDTLFHEGVGRTDLWGGDFEALARSIRHRLYSLPPETRVIPGHGPETTIGHEKIHNPFCGML